MSQLYDISYSDYEDGQRWVLEGPDLTNDEWEILWEDIRLKAIQIVGNKMDVIYEEMLLEHMVDLLTSQKGFKHIDATHHAHFNFAGSKGKDGLLKDVPEKWIPEFFKRFV